MTDAPFNTAEEALVFAFQYSLEQYPKNQLRKLDRTGKGNNENCLYGVDGAAQSAMIHSILATNLPLIERLVLTIRFSDNSTPCPCCGNSKPTDAWLKAADNLSIILSNEFKGISKLNSRKIIEKIINRKSINIISIAHDSMITRQTINRRLKAIKEQLDIHEEKALDTCRYHFAQRGIIH